MSSKSAAQQKTSSADIAPRRVTGVIGACFALTAFAVAMLAGITSQNPATSVIGRAIFVMVVCYVVGLIVGMIAQSVIDSATTEDATINNDIDALSDEEMMHDSAEVGSPIEDEEEVLVV